MKIKYISILMVSFILLSFSQKNKKPKPLFDAKKLEKSMKFIHGRRLILDSKLDNKTMNVTHVYSDSIVPFYMSDHEVSNLEYRNFLTSIRENDTLLYKKMLPDTSVWRGPLNYNEPFVTYYFRHPAYNDFPVVGISYEQSNAFCNWLTENYSKTEKKKFSQVKFTLPTKNQWVSAAIGNNCYAGNTVNLMNNKGKWLANFMVFNQEGIIKDEGLGLRSIVGDSAYYETRYIATSSDNSGGFGTTPVFSYLPNENKIYNMRGNVEEFVLEKGISKGGSLKDPGYYLQNLSEETYDTTKSASAERGFRVAMNFIK